MITIHICHRNQSWRMTTTVVRIKRKNGVVVQGCDVYIGRACNMGGWNLKQSKWRNPFSLKSCNNDRDLCLAKYRAYLESSGLIEDIRELKGKVLGCWCKDTSSTPCHGDILAELANELDN